MRANLLLVPVTLLLAQDSGPTIRISVNLVQIEAIVTDRSGRHVEDLKPEDFDIYQDGRLQKITNFAYIPGDQLPRSAAALPKGVTPPSVAQTRAANVRRVIALVADDLGLSFVTTSHVRDAMHRFVDQQMQPGDLVAILRTGGGIGALNQFTTDKRMLHAAIDKVQWSMSSRGGVEPLPGVGNEDINVESAMRASTQGTFRALRFVLDGIRSLPGRKTVILFSDGIRLPQPKPQNEAEIARVKAELEHTADRAARSSIAVYTVDARGLLALSLEARDDVTGLDSQDVLEKLGDRRDVFHENQNGLYALASMTGGTFLGNHNDMGEGIARALSDRSGYYLIGFKPENDGKYHRLQVKLKRPGLAVRHNKGYYGTEEKPAPRNWFSAPLAESAVRLKLTPLIAGSGKASVVQVLVHIDSRDLTFHQEAGGWQTAKIDIVAETMGDQPKAADTTQKAYTIRSTGETLKRIQSDGLIYNLQHTVQKPGAYHLRVAVRDEASGRVGSASQFIEVPDLKKGRMALTGIMMSTGDLRAAGNDRALVDAAVRVFERDKPFSYMATVLNATGDVMVQPRLFREGKEVWTGRPFAAVKQIAGGVITLGDQTTPGEYFLQVTAREKNTTATAWIDFELR